MKGGLSESRHGRSKRGEWRMMLRYNHLVQILKTSCQLGMSPAMTGKFTQLGHELVLTVNMRGDWNATRDRVIKRNATKERQQTRIKNITDDGTDGRQHH